MASYRYNELGQMVEKDILYSPAEDSCLQSMDYSYNIRGWLTSINNGQLTMGNANDHNPDLFELRLDYQLPGTIDNADIAPQYNGNISAMSWKNGDAEKSKVYGYG